MMSINPITLNLNTLYKEITSGTQFSRITTSIFTVLLFYYISNCQLYKLKVEEYKNNQQNGRKWCKIQEQLAFST